MRLTEVALFAAPLVAFVVWRMAFGRAGPAAPALAIAAAWLVLMAGVLVWFGLRPALTPNETYQPARLENGRVLPPGAPEGAETR